MLTIMMFDGVSGQLFRRFPKSPSFTRTPEINWMLQWNSYIQKPGWTKGLRIRPRQKNTEQIVRWPLQTLSPTCVALDCSRFMATWGRQLPACGIRFQTLVFARSKQAACQWWSLQAHGITSWDQSILIIWNRSSIPDLKYSREAVMRFQKSNPNATINY